MALFSYADTTRVQIANQAHRRERVMFTVKPWSKYNQHKLKEVYNADETALYYNMFPLQKNRSLQDVNEMLGW